MAALEARDGLIKMGDRSVVKPWKSKSLDENIYQQSLLNTDAAEKLDTVLGTMDTVCLSEFVSRDGLFWRRFESSGVYPVLYPVQIDRRVVSPGAVMSNKMMA